MKEKIKSIILGVAFFALCIGAALYQGNNPGGGQSAGQDENIQSENQGGLIRYSAEFWDIFDTKSDVVGYATDKETFTEQMTLIKERLEHYHKLFDIYNDYEGINNIKTINDNAAIAPVVVEREIIDLVLLSKDMYKQTNGQMNVAMGSVLKIWHNYRDAGMNNPQEAKIPSMEELKEVAQYTDIDKIIVDEAASTVYIADANMSLDVGSIGKGYAVQRVAEYAKEIGLENALFSVGGNICAVGKKPDGTEWKVGVQNPDLNVTDPYVNIVAVSDLSVVTSGDYQRYYFVDGKRYCHIIDGDTLMPADYFPAVTIIAKDSGVADALSTSVFNMPYEEGLAFVNGMDGVEAVWVFADGTLAYSDGFAQYIAD